MLLVPAGALKEVPPLPAVILVLPALAATVATARLHEVAADPAVLTTAVPVVVQFLHAVALLPLTIAAPTLARARLHPGTLTSATLPPEVLALAPVLLWLAHAVDRDLHLPLSDRLLLVPAALLRKSAFNAHRVSFALNFISDYECMLSLFSSLCLVFPYLILQNPLLLSLEINSVLYCMRQKGRKRCSMCSHGAGCGIVRCKEPFDILDERARTCNVANGSAKYAFQQDF